MAFKGFRNHYRESMPFTEKLLKDIHSLFSDSLSRWFSSGQYKTLVTYPDYPSKKTTIYKISKRLGWRITNKPVKHADFVLFFHDQTVKDGEDSFLQKQSRVINASCLDISKRKVDQVHMEVFEYNTFIDPRTYSGLALEKSDDNAQHDGIEIQCPIAEAKEGKIYQIIIDNSREERFVDYRVPVMKGHVPLVYEKIKTAEKRYTNEVIASALFETSDKLSQEEQKGIAAFCETMGAEFCELDVLRHNLDGKIYIVDLNTTPYGPPAGLSDQEHSIAVEKLTESFKMQFDES